MGRPAIRTSRRLSRNHAFYQRVLSLMENWAQTN